MQLKFCCPDCGGTELEEVMDRALVGTILKEVDPETGEPWYGEITIHDGVVIRFQCNNCGTHLTLNGNPITKWEELRDWLLDNVWVIYRPCATHEEDWIEVWTGERFTRSVHVFKPHSCFQVTSWTCVTQREFFFKILEEKGYLGQ